MCKSHSATFAAYLMRPDYPHKIFADCRPQYIHLMVALATDSRIG